MCLRSIVVHVSAILSSNIKIKSNFDFLIGGFVSIHSTVFCEIFPRLFFHCLKVPLCVKSPPRDGRMYSSYHPYSSDLIPALLWIIADQP